MAHVSARANSAVAAAIRGLRAIGHLALRRTRTFAQVLHGARRKPTRTNAAVAICDQAWSTTQGSTAIRSRVFRRQDRNQPQGTQLAQRQCHYASSNLIGAAFFLERANNLSATGDIVSGLAWRGAS